MSGALLAAVQQSDTGNNGAGALAFLVVGALFIAGWFLYRSLRRQLGRIDFDENAAATAPPAGTSERAAGTGDRSADPDR